MPPSVFEQRFGGISQHLSEVRVQGSGRGGSGRGGGVVKG